MQHHILVVDDDSRFREMARALLERAGHRVTEAEGAPDALGSVAGDVPDLVLLDVRLPRTSGYELYQELRDRCGESLPIIFVSGDRTDAYDRVAGLLLGADDYLVKPFDSDELLARIRRSLTARTNGAVATQDAAVDVDLTPREREVLAMLADGRSANQIAGDLVISPRTVGTHIQNILGKLGVNSRAQAVAYAHHHGLVWRDVEAHAANTSPPPFLFAS
jgi:DNA-binding NarL/FixJ family response regulator